MKKFLSIILAILMIVTTMPMAFAADRTLTIEMTDEFGDGWNGAAIEILKIADGEYVKVDETTVPSGSTKIYEQVFSDEEEYVLSWKKGSFDAECSFVIKVNGKTIFEITGADKLESNTIVFPFCNHDYTDSVCINCGMACIHAVFTDSVCDDCDFVCEHEGQNKSPCEICKAKIHICYDKGLDEFCDGCGKPLAIKILTSDNYNLFVDGERLDGNLLSGSYRLGGNITTKSSSIVIDYETDITIDLNGYEWNLTNGGFYLCSDLSIHDTSVEQSGKAISSRNVVYISTYDDEYYPTFSLYGGTLETTTERTTIESMFGSSNLYSGKIKSKGYAVSFYPRYPITINIDDVIFECGEGYSQIKIPALNELPQAIIDVSDYEGGNLAVDYTSSDFYVGKNTVFTGIENAEEAVKYTINLKELSSRTDIFLEKMEYDEATGEKFFCIAANAFTQQPSNDNNYTVEFNNSAATFQWDEVEETATGTYTVDSQKALFTYDAKAGDVLSVDTKSEFSFVEITVGSKIITLYDNLYDRIKSYSYIFESDETVDVEISYIYTEIPVELEFRVIRKTALDGETGKTLKNPECGKSYWCEATVYENVYYSDVVMGHNDNLVKVDAKAKTCSTIGWDAYEYCTECDYTTYVVIPASHDIEKVDAQAPTCTEIGWDAYEYCTECDYTTCVEKEALNHKDTLVKVDVKAPTCTEIGWDAYEYCTACDYTTYVEIPENGHTALDAVTENEVAAECGKEGSYDLVVYCDVCEDELSRETVTVDALTHVDADGDYKCDNGCGHKFEKPEEPTDDVCEDCGKVHTNFFSEIICFFTRIINFIKNLFK